jgi:hypothetical protein
MEKFKTIEGLPRFVEISTYKNTAFGYVRVDHPYTFTLLELSEALKMLAEYGFEYDSITYDLGYYESVDNKTIELIHRDAKKLKLIPIK